MFRKLFTPSIVTVLGVMRLPKNNHIFCARRKPWAKTKTWIISWGRATRRGWHSLGAPLALAAGHPRAARAHLRGETLQAAAAGSAERGGIHVTLNLLHLPHELGHCFAEPPVLEIVVEQSPDVGDGRLVQVDVTPRRHRWNN